MNNNNNSNNSNYIEYYMLNGWWGSNDWVTVCYCSNCGVLSNPEEITFNFYKVKDLYYCGPCYSEIGKRHAVHGVNWLGVIYWHGDSSDLQ